MLGVHPPTLLLLAAVIQHADVPHELCYWLAWAQLMQAAALYMFLSVHANLCPARTVFFEDNDEVCAPLWLLPFHSCWICFRKVPF